MDPTVSSQQSNALTAPARTGTTASSYPSSPPDASKAAPHGLPAQWFPRRTGSPAAGGREFSTNGTQATAAPRDTTVLIADPLAASRAELCAALAGGGIGRVIAAETIQSVEEIIADDIAGQLALVSLGFGDAAYGLIRHLRRGPWQRVIALAPTVDPDPLMAAVQAGASGVLRGRPGTPGEVPGPVHQLTAREIEVLSLVADGRSNKWIAEHLTLSALTVKSHLARISRKLGTGDRSHLVAIALRAGAIR